MLYILRADSLIAVGSLLSILVWLRPIPPPRAEEAAAGRPSWGVVVGFLPLFYLFTAAFGTLWTLLLWCVAEEGIASGPPAVYVVRPEPYFCVWGLPGLMLGIQCGGAAADLVLARLLGWQYYQSWVVRPLHAARGRTSEAWAVLARSAPHVLPRERAGLAVFHLVFLGPILGYVALFLPWNARFEQNRIVIHDLWAVGEQVYSYDDIDKVVAVSPDVGGGRIYVFFRDGRRWCDEDYGVRTVEYRADDDKFLAFLCENAGLPLTRVKSIEEVSGR